MLEISLKWPLAEDERAALVGMLGVTPEKALEQEKAPEQEAEKPTRKKPAAKVEKAPEPEPEKETEQEKAPEPEPEKETEQEKAPEPEPEKETEPEPAPEPEKETESDDSPQSKYDLMLKITKALAQFKGEKMQEMRAKYSAACKSVKVPAPRMLTVSDEERVAKLLKALIEIKNEYEIEDAAAD